jgi:hypothetical protein
MSPTELGCSASQKRSLTTLRTAYRSSFVYNDLEQPGPEGAANLKSTEGPKCFDEGELRHLFSMVLPRDERGDSSGHPLVHPH